MAFEESCTPYGTVRFEEKNRFSFWNINSTQFMYVPAFRFTGIRECERYRYDAVDEKGETHSFETDSCCALLTPIWRELPEGVVKLTVKAINPDGTDYALIGARVFFKLASFPENTPPAKCSYKDSAQKAYRFAMYEGFIQHWLTDGTPDPSYDLYVYPSKFISALVRGMISYAKHNPQTKDKALIVAERAAKWLIGITPRGNVPLADLPPTYYLDYCHEPEKYSDNAHWKIASSLINTNMMIYPAFVGTMYLDLENVTGKYLYLEEAKKIANYYVSTIEENGSWFLVRSAITGEPIGENYISPMLSIVPFFIKLYHRTHEEIYKNICDRAVLYVEKTQLATYNWEGQFEDTVVSSNYSNLSQYGPVELAKYHFDDKQRLKTAIELMRFAEDQFVVWNRFSPWHDNNKTTLEVSEDVPDWHTPAALEQYEWYVPIDASTAHIIQGFLSLYKAGCGEIYLAKARVLTDQITRMQQENGKIPTHWMNTSAANDNFWYNCFFESCEALCDMSEYENVVFE